MSKKGPPIPPGNRILATISLKRAGEWTPERRKEIAAWMRGQAKTLVRDGANYPKRFTARYMRVD